jgi:DNA-binding response OmpR family regulator
VNRSAGTLLAFVLEADLGPLIRHMLAACNWQVLVATSEAEAKELVSTTELDLLLLEVTPEAGARSAAERLRARTPGLPILYLSAWHDHPHLAELNGEPILPQPFSRDQLTRAIAVALGGAA